MVTGNHHEVKVTFTVRFTEQCSEVGSSPRVFGAGVHTDSDLTWRQTIGGNCSWFLSGCLNECRDGTPDNAEMTSMQILSSLLFTNYITD